MDNSSLSMMKTVDKLKSISYQLDKISSNNHRWLNCSHKSNREFQMKCMISNNSLIEEMNLMNPPFINFHKIPVIYL